MFWIDTFSSVLCFYLYTQVNTNMSFTGIILHILAILGKWLYNKFKYCYIYHITPDLYLIHLLNIAHCSVSRQYSRGSILKLCYNSATLLSITVNFYPLKLVLRLVGKHKLASLCWDRFWKFI